MREVIWMGESGVRLSWCVSSSRFGSDVGADFGYIATTFDGGSPDCTAEG